MPKVYDPRPALRQISPAEVDEDGRPWWPVRDICDALHCAMARNAGLIPREHIRKHYEYRPGWRSIIYSITDAEGAREIILRYTQIPAHEALRALIEGSEGT